MLSTDYFDWSQISGLYLENISHIERFRAYQKLISEAGLTVVIVADFLANNAEELNPVQWRSSSVYEMDDDLKHRLELTTRALEAIGATRVATAIRSAKSTSPSDITMSLMDGSGSVNPDTFAQAFTQALQEAQEQATKLAAECESRQEVEDMLENYAQAHQTSLKADISRTGDPRQQPGYSRSKRIAELDRLQRKLILKGLQEESAEELAEATKKLEKQLAKAGDDAKVLKRAASSRGDFREAYKKCQEIESEDRGPELNKALEAAEKLIAAHAEFFQPPVSKDAELNARIANLGPFVNEMESDANELSWDAPTGYSGPWGNYRLVIEFPPGKSKVLARLIRTAESIRDKLADLSMVWQQEMCANFRSVYAPEMDKEELAEYSVDESGKVTDASILEHAGLGTIRLIYEDGELFAET